MQRIIHLLLLCLGTFVAAVANDKPAKTPSNEVFKPRHDGKHFFIAPKVTVAQPTQADIESAIADAQTQGRIIKITSSGFNIPAALKEIASLPVTFRNQIDGWNYDITVFAMTFTPQGSKLSIGCKFNLPNDQAIYFGANDIATSGRNGFMGELPILETSLTDAKQAELDDVNGLLGGETQFYEVSIPNFNDKLKMGLGRDTKLFFECGTFKKFTLSGYLKSFDVVERENSDGSLIGDSKPLMLFFGTKDVFDWQDMYFEASVSRSFHHANLKELGFNFSATNKAIIDLSKTQNPANLPTCVNADAWQGVYFPTFQVRLPQFFKLREGVTLASRTGKNLFIDKTGLLGNMTAEKVYDLPEGYTDDVNMFDMSLDLLSANFVCNQAPIISMLGRIQLGKCSSASNQADKLLYYNVIYDKVRNGYSFLVKDKESGNYSSNSLTLETGSTVNFGISGNSLVLNAKLSKTPIISTTAYNNSICSNFETTLSLSDCATGMFKWSTTTGDENVNPLIIKPITTLTNEQVVYQANCFDKYCISENSNAITLTVYNGLPDLTLSSDKSVMCSYETATLNVGNTCVGKINWISPENATFVEDNVSSKTVNYPTLSSTENKTYQVRCNLSGCISNQTNIATADIRIKKAPDKPLLSSDDTNNKVCSGKNIIISGNCNATDTFKWTAGLTDSDSNPFTLTTDVNNPQNKTHIYKATCTNEGCTTENDLTINEYAIPKPTQFFAVRNPIEIGGLVEIVAMGCPQGTDVWSNGKTGVWNGWNGSEMKEHISEKRTYSVRCVVNGCSSLPTNPITVYVVSCEEALAAPKYIGSNINDILPNTGVSLAALGCESMSYEWSNGMVTVGNGGSSDVTVYPSETTKYKVRCKKDDNCKSGWTAEYEVRVKTCEDGIAAPRYIGSDINDVVPNSKVSLAALGCETMSYEWSNGMVTVGNGGSSDVTVYPSETTKYKVRCKKDDNCKSGWTAEYEVRVKTCEDGIAAPTYLGSNVNDVLPNAAVSLSALGCESMNYEWSNGAVTAGNGGSGNTTVYPSETIKYRVRCKKDDNCKSGWTAEFEVRVKATIPCATPPAPPVISADKNTLDSNDDTVTLTASNCSGIINWSNGTTGTKTTVSTAATYSATCTVDGCVSGKSNEVTISKEGCRTPSAPVISADKTVLKESESVELTATGCAGSISWSNGSNGSKINVSTAAKYTAKCRVNACESISSNEITITKEGCTIPATPSISIDKTSVSYQETITISVGACSAGNLVWTSPSAANQIGSHTITSATIYSVKCVDKTCESAVSSKEVCVLPAKPNITADKTSFYSGEEVSVTATCSGTVTWVAPSGFIGGKYSPTSSTTFKAKCINPCGNSEETSVDVTLTPSPCANFTWTPVLSMSEDCGTKTLTITNCANGVVNWKRISWNLLGQQYTVENHTGSSWTFNTGANSLNYRNLRVTCTQNGCTSVEGNPADVPNVQDLPTTPRITTDSRAVCSGTNVTLSATGCNYTYVWNNDLEGASITVKSTSESKYKVKCVNKGIANCSSGESVECKITIEAIPQAPSISSNKSSITGTEKAIFTASGCAGTIKWSNGSAGTSIEISGQGGDYTATCTTSCGTSSVSNSINISYCVGDASTPTITANRTCICSNNGIPVTLTASNCNGVLDWTTKNVGVGTYTVKCTKDECNSKTATIIIPSLDIPSASITNNSNLPEQALRANCTNGANIQWFKDDVYLTNTYMIDTKSILTTTHYKLICTNDCGSAFAEVYINP